LRLYEKPDRVDEFLAKAQKRKVRKGSCGNLSSFAMTDALINACCAKLVATASGGVPGSIRPESI
jgi:hypothetical protein